MSSGTCRASTRVTCVTPTPLEPGGSPPRVSADAPAPGFPRPVLYLLPFINKHYFLEQFPFYRRRCSYPGNQSLAGFPTLPGLPFPSSLNYQAPSSQRACSCSSRPGPANSQPDGAAAHRPVLAQQLQQKSQTLLLPRNTALPRRALASFPRLLPPPSLLALVPPSLRSHPFLARLTPHLSSLPFTRAKGSASCPGTLCSLGAPPLPHP